MQQRLRFAPSPTGYFHVGSARTALYNWLHTRRHGGVFILRIEDTDAERGKEEWVEGILSALRWLGLDWDEGPLRQSTHADRHRGVAADLVAAGHAYYCDCTREQVLERTRDNATPGYDGHCRDRGLDAGPGRAVRFRSPSEGITVVRDIVRGDVEFPNATIEDFVLLTSDGRALFLLANVVDDLDENVTHVVRGEDHLPNTPKYQLIWQAVSGNTPPVFAHLPLLVNEKRQKLSKRRDPVAVEDYRARGFLPEAFVNYLALLGWAPADGREIMSREELIERFDLDQVNSSPAFFDVTKLTHFNGEYIRAMADDEFVAACRPWLEEAAWPRYDESVFARLAPLVKERVSLLGDVVGMVDFLFLADPEIDDAAWAKAVANNAAGPAMLTAVAEGLETCEWDPAAIRSVVERAGEAHQLKLGRAQAPVRVAVTGRTVGPPLFEAVEILGREETLRRLRAALERLA